MGIRLALIALLLAAPLARAGGYAMVFRPKGDDFVNVVRAMQREIADDITIQQVVLAPDAKTPEMAEPLRQTRPRIVILMDNRVISLYKHYLATLPDSTPPIPCISLMAASVEREIAGMKQAWAIEYEIPILTSAVNLRGVLEKPLPRIGILHREYLSRFVSENAGYCRREGIEFATIVLKNKEDDFARSVRQGLKTLFEDKKIEALWVPNDNALLTADLLRDVWIPLVNKYKKPVIVGVEALARPDLSFGTFAVLPDHAELGRQLADMVLEVSDSSLTDKAGRTRQPLSIIKVIDLPQAKKFFGGEPKHLENVDKVLE